MAKAKIKPEHKDLFVVFGKSPLPLGMRDDLDELAEIAIKHNDAYLLSLFEVLPSEEEILESQGEKFIDKTETEPKKKVSNADKK